MDKIVQKSTYPGRQNQQVSSEQPVSSRQKYTSGQADNTRSHSGAMVPEKKEGTGGIWAKGMASKFAETLVGSGPMVECELEEVPPPEGYLFKKGDHVVLQSARDKTITGTVRWVGQVKTSKEAGSIPIKAVGVETVSNDNVNIILYLSSRM